MNCNCLIHPFQNDPGVSQRQRIMDELLAGAAKIDARTLADLLDYFMQMSGHINYYDLNMRVGNWQPFFKNSTPFTLTTIIKYRPGDIEKNFRLYQALFQKKPSAAGLQLNLRYIYYHFIYKINNWYLALKDSDLPLQSSIELLIREKLQSKVKDFIGYANAAGNVFGTKRIDFNSIYQNSVWNISQKDLYYSNTGFTNSKNKYKKLTELNKKIEAFFPSFLTAVKLLSVQAEKDLQLSLISKKAELQQTHQPHLALVFTFLNLFRFLQDDLNNYTRKHLDFFFKHILQLKPQPAVPDKAHVLFEIQTQLKSYLLKKGRLLKGGKDGKKQEILFGLDGEIVVNKTELADTRTLFLNNQTVNDTTYVEGVYMATNATKADGKEKEFQGDVKNFPTVGGKFSKYTDPDTDLIQPYQNARLGFVLASPVLYLQGGTRRVVVTLACKLDRSVCQAIGQAILASSGNCCNPEPIEGKDASAFPPFVGAQQVYDAVRAQIGKKYIYLNETVLRAAIKKGFKEDVISEIRDLFFTEKSDSHDCYCETKKYMADATILFDDWDPAISAIITDKEQRELFDTLFQPRTVFRLFFSGEKQWIVPDTVVPVSMSVLQPNDTFTLTIESILSPELPPVVFFDKDKLKEDLGTTQPVLKIELDDQLKLALTKGHEEQDPRCCLEYKDSRETFLFSYYHFFRNVRIEKQANIAETAFVEATRINVNVCGLNKFIVQSDESVQDLNGPVYPFGVRPKVESNFYVGSEEIFLKHWTDIYLNLNWKDLPADFEDYYRAYQVHRSGLPPGNVVKGNNFKTEIAVLLDGDWVPWKYPVACADNLPNKKYNLFQKFVDPMLVCADPPDFKYQYAISHDADFAAPAYPLEKLSVSGATRFDKSSRNGFLRITLKCQDFQHSLYPFILARQMMAFGKLPKETVDGAVYYDQAGNPVVFSSDDIKNQIIEAKPIMTNVVDQQVDSIDTEVFSVHTNPTKVSNIKALLNQNINIAAHDGIPAAGYKLVGGTDRVKAIIDDVTTKIGDISKFAAIIPNEPWTPVISNLSLSYKAVATPEQVDLVHLYPFPGTYKPEEISLQPTLLATFCDEGTLFLGLKGLEPGSNLNLLFQVAEATADSESAKEEVRWHYLDSNNWKPLRKGFEVLNDATENLTASGIIKLAIPENISTGNTVLPKELYWIKASIAKNSAAVGETTGIHPQAIQAVFTNTDANDKTRLGQPLAAGTISKLNDADASVKSVKQPYDSFGGQVPEEEQLFYVRVSELLRHKRRAIQPWDYERIALQAFPQLFKAKCISHSFALDAHRYKNDFPCAPGYVILAVIPDLTKLKAGNSFEPKVPVSIIEKIESLIRKRTSPFVRFRVMNPRYEKVNFCIRIQLLKGRDENYYRDRLRQDLSEFLAPWAVGQYDKLTFGQCVYRSDIVRFLENRDYVDFITDLRMGSADQQPDANTPEVCPVTPRSILIAGDIEICIDRPVCPEWGDYRCGEKPITACENKPEPVIDYCRHTKNQWKNG